MIALTKRFGLRRTPLSLATALAIACLAPQSASAQAVATPELETEQEVGTELQTVAVAALAGYDALLTDVDFIGELGGRPATADMVEGMLAFFTGGRGLEGLDKSRPIGVVLQTDGMSFTPLACLPVADPTPMLELAENFGFEPIDIGDGVYELELPEQVIYFQQVGAWTYVAQKAEALEYAPADPGKMLKSLVEKYDLGVTLMAQNVPDMYRQIALEQLRQGMEDSLEQEDDESDEDYQSRRDQTEAQIDQLADMIDGLDRVTIGWNIDSEGRRTFIDAELTGAAGSDMTLAMSVYDDSTSGVTGFHRPEAAASVLTVGTTPPELLEKQAAQFDSQIAMFRKQAQKAIEESDELPDDPEARESLQAAADDLLDAYADILRSGRIELGGSLDLSGAGFDLIAGAYVVDPSKVESAFKKLAEAFSKDEKFPGVEWGYAEHAGVTLHGMSVPVPPQADALRDAVGDTIRVVMGVGGDRVYMAAGPRGEESLKRAIDESAGMTDKQILPAELIVSVGQILAAAEPLAPGEAAPVIGMLLEAMEDVPAGTDRLVVTTEAIENGVRIRYLLEEGVLKAIGESAATAAAMQAQGGGGGGGF